MSVFVTDLGQAVTLEQSMRFGLRVLQFAYVVVL